MTVKLPYKVNSESYVDLDVRIKAILDKYKDKKKPKKKAVTKKK